MAKSKEEVLSDLLAVVPDSYDKRPGSFIYDALAPVAEEIAGMDQGIDGVKEQLDINNLTGSELAQRVRERTGITRKDASLSSGHVLLTGTGTINAGDLFETPGGVQFRATENKNIIDSGPVNIEAVLPGAAGNVPANTITLFPVTLAGFTAVTNPEPTLDGFDAESDEDLLERYYERIRTPATSGNQAHYLGWAKEVQGVGDARIQPLWNGPNTVKVILIDSNKQPASETIVEAVQTYIDPGSSGTGAGQAPIGAYTTVVSADGIAIDVTVTATLETGYTQEQATENIEASLRQYLKDIAFVESIVSYARVGAAILSSPGVADYSGLTINGSNVNVVIGSSEVAILGAVTVNVA